MKAKTIRYERLQNLGDYQHEKIAVELEVEEGEKAVDVLEKAKQFVTASLGNDVTKTALEIRKDELLRILNSSEDYTIKQVNASKALLADIQKAIDDSDKIPF